MTKEDGKKCGKTHGPRAGRNVTDRRKPPALTVVERGLRGDPVMSDFRALIGSDVLPGTVVKAANLVDMVRAIERGGFGGQRLPDGVRIQRKVGGKWVPFPRDIVDYAVGCARRAQGRLFKVVLAFPVSSDGISIKVVDLGVHESKSIEELLDAMDESGRYPVCFVLEVYEFWKWEWLRVPHSDLMTAKNGAGCNIPEFKAVIRDAGIGESTVTVEGANVLDALDELLSMSHGRGVKSLINVWEDSPVEDLRDLVAAFKRDVLKRRW